MPQPSPRFITAAEVAQDEAGDVQGPDSSVDGNIALFDGVTGKLLKAAGVVEGVATIDSTTNILIGDGAGNAVDSNVGIDAIGGSFLAVNTARVDPSGSDDTGEVGDLSKPFLTVQAAIDELLSNEYIVDVFGGVILLPAINITEELTMSIGSNVTAISFKGYRGSISLPFQAFKSLTITGTGGTVCEIFMQDCSVGGSDLGVGITTTIPLFLFLENVDGNGSSIVSTYSTGLSGLDIISASGSGGGFSEITAMNVGIINVFGVFPASGGSVINGDGNTMNISNVRNHPDDDAAYDSLWSIANVPNQGTVNACNAVLGDVACGGGTWIDSRSAGSFDLDGGSISYEDVLLKSVPPGGTTGQALEKNSDDDFDTVWNDL